MNERTVFDVVDSRRSDEFPTEVEEVAQATSVVAMPPQKVRGRRPGLRKATSYLLILLACSASFMAGRISKPGELKNEPIKKVERTIEAPQPTPVIPVGLIGQVLEGTSAEELAVASTPSPVLQVTEVPNIVSKSNPMQHPIVRGDILWHISERLCPSPFYFIGIALDNNITNPDVIPVGKVLTITCRKTSLEEEKRLYPDDLPQSKPQILNTPAQVAEVNGEVLEPAVEALPTQESPKEAVMRFTAPEITITAEPSEVMVTYPELVRSTGKSSASQTIRRVTN